MSDNFLNNPTQTPSEENNKILETLELICDLLLDAPANNLSLQQLPPLIEFSRQINLNLLETAILALTNSADPDADEVTEKFLIKKLRHFCNDKRSPIRHSLHSLCNPRRGWIAVGIMPACCCIMYCCCAAAEVGTYVCRVGQAAGPGKGRARRASVLLT